MVRLFEMGWAFFLILAIVYGCSGTNVQLRELKKTTNDVTQPVPKFEDGRTYKLNGLPGMEVRGRDLNCITEIQRACLTKYYPIHQKVFDGSQITDRVQGLAAEKIVIVQQRLTAKYKEYCQEPVLECTNQAPVATRHLIGSLAQETLLNIRADLNSLTRYIGNKRSAQGNQKTNILLTKYKALGFTETVMALISVDESVVGRNGYFMAVVNGKEGRYYNAQLGDTHFKLKSKKRFKPFTMLKFIGQFQKPIKKRTLIGVRRIPVIRLKKIISSSGGK